MKEPVTWPAQTFVIFTQKENIFFSNYQKKTFSKKKKILILSQKKPFSYISGRANPKKLIIFEEVAFQAQKIKKIDAEKTS